MTNELIVTREVNGDVIVDARELYEFVGSKERFSKWWDRMLSYGFIEGVEYTPYQKVHPQNKQVIDDYAMKLDMAKEIAMVQRNEKGKQARLYFIEVEKKMKANVVMHSYMIEDPIKRAEKWIEEHKEKLMLEQKIEEQEPLVAFADKCLKSKTLILVRQLAKLISEQGVITIGEKKLYQKLRDWGLIMKGCAEPTQRAMNMGIFQVIQRTINKGEYEILSPTTKVTPKGQMYIIKRLNDELKKSTETKLLG